MNAAASLLALIALAAAAPADGDALKQLDRGCAEVRKAYPLLMLAAMAEGPMNCGTHTGDYVDCDASDTAEEAAKQAKRLEIRKRQEAVFERASEACDLYAANRKLESAQRAAAAGLALAREIGTDLPEELKETPPAAAPR
ncbi:hypothetical protein [Sphingosinicella sp. LY1275]|uniref:hypothetical protein n=1 Tax=Sphingosinicella sp. LY1275 TaxID=3095379 RepID=UPI002ADEEEDF|nr:hypothetical protein [Sphingosinicella sp. LY1275]MEA1014756.1 hypothetical protein [Sphingosinicella sp. LY1275]